ncbi:MAG TPA: hypothetical protein VMF09_03950 [Solirubrobacteraceae bacterium]|nr:hypothetical protein [Solirubrobacteraceae bacterium]
MSTNTKRPSPPRTGLLATAALMGGCCWTELAGVRACGGRVQLAVSGGHA